MLVFGYAHRNRRYSNTLLLTLNNRIYFRDHPSPEVPGDSAYVAHLASGNREGQLSKFAAQDRPSESTASDGISMRLHTLHLASGNREGQLSKFPAQDRPSESAASDDISMRLHTLLPPTDTERVKSEFVITSPITP